MSDLGPEARTLLDSTREGDDPSDRDRARVRSRLNLALAAAAGGAATTATAKVAATNAGVSAQLVAGAQTVAATSLSAKIGVAVTVAVISVASTGVVLKREQAAVPSERRAQKSMVVLTPRAKPPVAVARAVALVIAPVIEELAVEEQAPRIEPPAEPGRRKSAVAQVERTAEPIAPSLQTELELLSAAQAALRERDDERALSLVAVHAARYPSGVLALERDAVRAIALCNAGRVSEGRAVVAGLSTQLVQSPLAARIERACEER